MEVMKIMKSVPSVPSATNSITKRFAQRRNVIQLLWELKSTERNYTIVVDKY